MFSITISIIVITAIVSFSAFNSQKVMFDLVFWPARMNETSGQWYRFWTYGFIHADLAHIIFNMYSLYSFGQILERYLFGQPEIFGSKSKLIFLILYLTAIAVSVIPDYFKNRNNFGYRAVGASGAVSAIVFATILLYPQGKMGLVFIPIMVPGYVFGILFLVISAILEKRGNTNIGHGTHIYGALYGLLFTIVATKLFSDFDVIGNFIDSIRR